MKRRRFDRLVASLGDVRRHVVTGHFSGRISKIEVGADDIRAVRERSGMTQQQFAKAFGIGLGTFAEVGARRTSPERRRQIFPAGDANKPAGGVQRTGRCADTPETPSQACAARGVVPS